MSTRHSARLSVANRSPSTLPASAAVWRASLNRSIASRLEPAKWSASPRIPSASTSNAAHATVTGGVHRLAGELDRRAEPAAPELDGREPAQHLRAVTHRRVGPEERRRLLEGALRQREMARVPQELAIVGPQGPRTRRVVDGSTMPSARSASSMARSCRPTRSAAHAARTSRSISSSPRAARISVRESASTRSCSSSAASQWSSAEVDARRARRPRARPRSTTCRPPSVGRPPASAWPPLRPPSGRHRRAPAAASSAAAMRPCRSLRSPDVRSSTIASANSPCRKR